MRNNYLITFLMLGLLLGGGCRSLEKFFNGKEEKEHESIESKTEPYDLFSFERSYPDRDFDWQGWRKAIQQTRQNEASVSAERSCPGQSLNWTLQGASNVAGRVNSIAVQPGNESTILAGFSGGGIFKSIDGGVNWFPIFDDQPELAIGDITFDPSNPNVVYAGTGDPNIPSIVFNGNGVYKSTDAGNTWSHLGLSQQGIISKILVDPTDPNTLYVAAMGNPYVRTPDRGIYKTADGGQSWVKVLFISNQAGASDLIMDPQNPQILYASFWDRIRNNHESVIYGTHAKVYKSIDGGSTWAILGGGLPTGIMGRTGLAISQQNPNKVYAIYVDTLSTVGGLYKSADGGTSWNQMNTSAIDDAFSDFGWYFGKVRVNPTNDDDVYILGVLLWRKASGSNTWLVGAGAHADTHDLVFTPSGRRLLATDGGVYRNEPNSVTWVKSKNLPTTQFYHTNYNPHTPDIYWGGAQDNGIQTGNKDAINNWVSIFSADGFHSLFHPTDSNTYWIEIQNGTIHKTSDGGNTWQYGQAALGTGDRCNWDMPVFTSVHNPNQFYAGTYRVYSGVGASGWSAVSPDLTNGVIYGDRFHNISALAESPLVVGKLLAGTSDGNVFWRDLDNQWYTINMGLPNRYVTSVCGSPSTANRFFVTHSGFRDNENIPHIHRTDNSGLTWLDISGNLPQIPVNDLFVLPGHADSIMFVATDAGVYFTLNSGVTWNRLGSNLPYLPVFDLEENPVRKELVAATYARGIWTFPLDSLLSQQEGLLVSVSGDIRTETDSAVAHVIVGNDITGTDGLFDITGVPGCQTFVTKPYRNTGLLNGVSTFDLALISKHILGIDPLPSPYKIIAADANKSNSVTTFDIVVLRKLLLGIDTVLTGNTSWRFVPANFTFQNPQNPFTSAPFPDSIQVTLQTLPVSNVNFVGIKIGDVNGSVAATSATGSHSDDRQGGEWPITVREEQFSAGDRVSADFSGDLVFTAGTQFSLFFDPGRLILEKIEPLAPGISADHFASNRAAGGVLSFAYENPWAKPSVGQADAQPMFRVIFRARQDGSFSQSLRLGNTPTPSIAYQSDGTALQPVLHITAKTDVGEAGIYPNPFGDGGAWLELPAFLNAPADLQIFDNQGKMIFEKEFRADETPDRCFLSAAIFPSKGIYFWKISAGKTVFHGKMVFQ